MTHETNATHDPGLRSWVESANDPLTDFPATTPTSTPRSTTPRTSARCSAPTTRCCPTTSGSPWATTAGPRRSSPAARPSFAPPGRPRPPRRAAPRASGPARCSTTSSRWASSWARQRAGRADLHRGRRGPHPRALPAQRLVGPRHAEVGVPAARAVPRQELRDHRQPLHRDDGGPRARSAARASSGPRATPRPSPPRQRARPHGGRLDITLEVYLADQQMRDKGIAPHRLSKGNFKDMYWTVAQMLTHHASNGCNMQPGDLLGSGTVSGPDPRRPRLPARADLGRRPVRQPARQGDRGRPHADRAAERRAAQVPRRRRRDHPQGLLRARGLPADRVRRVPGDRHPGYRLSPPSRGREPAGRSGDVRTHSPEGSRPRLGDDALVPGVTCSTRSAGWRSPSPCRARS
jgi:hypothetical protein